MRFLFPFGVYLLTLAGSYLADDSPETIYAIGALEHQHPPGYPLVTLLGRLAACLPVGGFAFRINLFGAALVALACVQVGRLADRLHQVMGGTGRLPGTAVAVLAALGHTAWAQAVSAKGAVYGLNAVLLLELVRLVIDRGSAIRLAAFAGLVAGLGVANHWMSIVVGGVGLVAGLFVGAALSRNAKWIRISDSIKLKPVFVGLLFFHIASSAYLFLPIRSSSSPPLLLNWGRPESLRQFVWHVSRAQYAPIEAGERPEGYWPARLGHLGRVAIREWSVFVLAGCGWGSVRLMALAGGAVGPAIGVGAAVISGVLLVSHPPAEKMHITEPYLLPVWMLLALGGGAMVARLRPWHMGWVALGLLAFTGAAIRGIRIDASRYYLSHDYGWNLLLAAPRDAVMFAETDYDLFALLEHHGIERRRPDVTVAAAVFLDYDWYRETAHRILPEVIPRAHELGEYTVRPVRPLVYTSQHGGGEGVLKPVGLVLRPPLGEGYGLVDSARVWRAVRFRGLWQQDPDRYRLAQGLLVSYGVQMLRFAGEARGADPELAVVAFRKAARYPQELGGRIMARYSAAQLLLLRLPAGREARAAALAAATRDLDRIISEEPRFWRAHLLKGNALFMAGDRAGARDSLERALGLLPADAADRPKIMSLLRGL